MTIRIPTTQPLLGIGPPAAALGDEGDLYYEIDAQRRPRAIHGPKTATGWGPPTPTLGAPLVDQINRFARDLGLGPGATVSALANHQIVTLRQLANDYATVHAILPRHWQTLDVDVYWTVLTATAGSPSLRFDSKSFDAGVSIAGAFDSLGSVHSGPADGQYVLVKSTIAQNVVVDPTKEILGRIIRAASPADGLAANIGITRVVLRRSL